MSSMLQLLTDPNAWVSLLTLTVLEIVLGIDNIIFLSIISGRLPDKEQPSARRVGLALALAMRIAMLSGIVWIISLSKPLFTIMGLGISWRDIILAAGGLFLLTKGTREIHGLVEGEDEANKKAGASYISVIIQIALFDLVFSIDSVITAVGMAEHLSIMIAAVVLAIFIMLVASEPVARFVHSHPTVKMLALSFLLLIGTALIADGAHFHIPRGYLYFAVAFSGLVEGLNQMAHRRKNRREAS
jgi:predicted tellurium resistance membrane protein TerC